MPVFAIYECGGCDAKTDKILLKQRFEGVTGRPWGFGHYEQDQPKEKAPEGWVPYDQIGCCYCPECAEELWPTTTDAIEARAQELTP